MKKLLCFSLVFLSAGVAGAAAENIKILGKEYESLGIVVSKSAIAQKASLKTSDLDYTYSSVYLPAGTVINLLDHGDSRNGKKRNLGITEFGTMVYLVSKPDKRKQYFDADALLKLHGDQFVVSHDKVEVPTENYGTLTITPSEHYRFEFDEGNQIKIEIDQRKVGGTFKGVENVLIPEVHFSIVTKDEIENMRNPIFFLEYSLEAEIEDLKKSLSDLDIDEKDREKFLSFLENRFSLNKKCDELVTVSHGIEGEAGLKLDNLLSPLTAKLGVSGSYASQTEYEKGKEFSLQRYVLSDQVFEVKNETNDENCDGADFTSRMLISDEENRIGQITSETAKKLKLELSLNELPVYRCREQFLKLVDGLTQDWEISYTAAILGVMEGARFKGKDASTC